MAGRVAAVGKSVTQFNPGDEVFGEVHSAYAEYVCVAADRIGPKPTNLTFEQAAAVPLAAITALQGLRDKARVQPGAQGPHQWRLGRRRHVRRADRQSTGSRRHCGMQHAQCGHCSFPRCRPCHRLHPGELHAIRTRFDAILDLTGSRPLSDCVKLLVPTGVYVSSVGRLGWVLKVAVASLSARGRGKIVLLTAHQTQQDLAILKEMLESGKIKPAIDRLYTLAEVPEALQYLGQGHAQGRIVVTV